MTDISVIWIYPVAKETHVLLGICYLFLFLQIYQDREEEAGGDAGETVGHVTMTTTEFPFTSSPTSPVEDMNETKPASQDEMKTNVRFEYIYNDDIENEQKRRKTLVNRVCQREPELRRSELYMDTYAHIYVNDRHKLLFCYIPKVGCSNWKRVLMILAGKNKTLEEITSREAHSRNGLKVFRRLSVWERQYALKTYKKIMFVREPFSRILSAYKNKYGDLNVYRNAPKNFHYYAQRIVRKYRERPTQDALRTGENITFHEFVDYLTDVRERSNFDRHWKEMYKLCSPCNIKYDFLGKLENLGKEANYVLGSIPGARDIVSYPEKTNSHPTNTSMDIVTETLSAFSNETLSKLWNIYKLDFELFGYEKPDFIPT